MLVLPDAWRERWQGKDVFAQLFSIEGWVYREREGRKTLQFNMDGESYFAKFHGGVGWKEILKNISQFRLPVTSASNEWRAIKRLNHLGVHTPRLVGYGKRGWNPARLKSFVVMEELTHSISLEDLCREWPESPPSDELKRALIMKVAGIARILHENGLNHRDFYICHFLLNISGGRDQIDPKRLQLYLIDLHRVQIRRHTPNRWRVKDIAGLYFSTMDIGLKKRDILRFMRLYRNKTLKATLKEDSRFWRQVKKRGDALYRKRGLGKSTGTLGE